MFYTCTPPTHQGDRIRLFPSVEAARAAVAGDHPIHEVAVDLDNGDRRIVPQWKLVNGLDSAWATPAERDTDGSVIAKGPIPRELFVNERNEPDVYRVNGR